MLKRKLFYALSFSIISLFLYPTFAEDNSTDSLNNSSLVLDGKISKQTTVWRLEFNYGDDKEVKGEFKRGAPVKLPKNRYAIELNIGEKLYKGDIYYLIKLFQGNEYEIDLDCNDIPLTGKIRRSYKGVYKKDEFDLRYDNKTKFRGFILYERENDGKNFNITFGDKKITGKIFTESRGIKSIKKVNLRFNDKKIIGSIEKKAGTEQYSLKADNFTEEDLFVFFFLMIYQEIDDYNEEIKDQ